MPLSIEMIQRGLSTNTFGQTVIYYNQIGSTNTELKAMAAVGAPEGMLAVADEQIAGRGRFDRRWLAPAGSSLLASLLFRPIFLPPTQVQQLTMLCSLAAVDAIYAETGITAGIKWPNDLVFGGQKLAGFLTELGFDGNQIEWAVVGMGLNVNLDFSTADDQLAQTATSLQMIAGKRVNRVSLLQAYLANVESRYEQLRAGQSPREAWAARLVTLGNAVRVTAMDGVLSGVAESVGDDGALLVRLADGRLERVLAGDVTLR